MTDLDTQAVAYLCGEGHPQNEIAQLLKLSAATVSRCIQRAKDHGWLRVSTQFVRDAFSEERLRQIEARVQPKELAKALTEYAEKFDVKGRDISIRVFPGAPSKPDDVDAEYERFGQAAASYVYDLLETSRICGVSWGWTIAGLVFAMGKLSHTRRGSIRDFKSVPLCGEPWGVRTTKFSSSSLAAQLDEIMRGEGSDSLSLAGIPAIVPRGFSRTALDELLQLAEPHREIFGAAKHRKGAPPPLAERLDTVITGIGTDQTPLGFWNDQLIKTAGLDRERLSDKVLGDICGTLIPRPKLSASDRKEVARINDLWTGVRLEHLVACAARARRKDAQSPGVIVVARGRRKTSVLLECVRMGVVNCLVVDEELGDSLKAQLQSDK